MSISNLKKWHYQLPEYQYGKYDFVAYTIILIALAAAIFYFGYIGILYVVIFLIILAFVGELITKSVKKYRDTNTNED